MVFWHATGAAAILMVGLVAGRRVWFVRRLRRRRQRRRSWDGSTSKEGTLTAHTPVRTIASLHRTHLGRIVVPCWLMQVIVSSIAAEHGPGLTRVKDRLLDDIAMYFKELVHVMLDALAEIRKFQALPVNESEVQPVGGQSRMLEQVSVAITKLAKQQYRSNTDVQLLLAQVDKLAENAVGRQINATVSNSEDAESKLIEAFLPIVDTFDDACRAVLELGDAEWSNKFQHLLDQINHQLEHLNLKPMAAEGAPFNPDFHEAIGVYSAADPAYAHVAPDCIGYVYRRGFMWKGKLLRRAQVIPVR